MKILSLFVFVMLMVSCTAKSGADENLLLVDDAILDVKQTLPKKNNAYTVWKDIYRDGATIKLIYQMDNYTFPKDKIYLLEEYAKSDSVKNVICKSLLETFGWDYSVESITYDMNDTVLLSFVYSKKNC